MTVGFLDQLRDQSLTLLRTEFERTSVPKAVVAVHAGGRLVEVNPALCALLGYPRADLLGRRVELFFDGADRATVGATLASMATGRSEARGEWRLVRRDGTRVWVSGRAVVVTAGTGENSENSADGAVCAVVEVIEATDLHAATVATEEALRRSEEQFRTAFDGSPMGLLIVDEEGRFLQANAAAAALTGRVRESLVGLTYADITDPRDLASDAGTAARQRDGDLWFDKRLLHPDGRTVWTRLTLSLMPGPAGESWRLMRIEDITREREATLRAEREVHRLRATLRVQREVTAAAADRGTTLRVVAEQAVELFPAADGSVVELRDGEHLRYEAAAGALAQTVGTRVSIGSSLSGSVLTTGAPAHCRDTAEDPRVDRATCERLNIRAMLIAPLHAGDQVIGALKISSARPHSFDDTDEQQLGLLADSLSSALRHADDAARNATLLAERTAALAAQRAAHAQLEQQARLLQLIPAAVIVRSLDGTIRWWNTGAEALYGWTLPSAEGRTTHRLLATAFPAGVTERDQADSLVQEGRWEGQLRHNTADGRTVTVLSRQVMHRSPDAGSDALGSVLEVNTDVTAARAAETARDEAAAALADRNAELERANQLKLDLIGMLGHEIGNPLAAILGYAEVFTDNWPELDDARRGRAVHGIARQARRLDDIVREVLAMVSIDAGSLSARREPRPVLAEIRAALATMDSEHVPVAGNDVTVLVNPGHLQQMLTNLLSNAAKYGGGATAVRVITGDGRARVRIEDSGPGVPDEFRHRLFERMARADRDARTVKGTGLGLYIVRGLARANHGDVTHEPNPDGGSVFALDLEAATG